MSNSRRTKTWVRKVLRGNLNVLTIRGWIKFLNSYTVGQKPLPKKTAVDRAHEKRDSDFRGR